MTPVSGLLATPSHSQHSDSGEQQPGSSRQWNRIRGDHVAEIVVVIVVRARTTVIQHEGDGIAGMQALVL